MPPKSWIIVLYLLKHLDKIKTIGIFLVLLIACGWHYGPDYWFSKWTVLLFIAAIYLGYKAAIFYSSKLAGLAYWWVITMGLWVYSWQDNYYSFFSRVMRCSYDMVSPNDKLDLFQIASPKLAELQWTTAYTAVSFLILTISVTLLSARLSMRILKSIRVLALVSSIGIILQYIFLKDMSSLNAGIFFNQASLEGCFIAIVYPLIILIPEPAKSFKSWQNLLNVLFVFLPPLATLCLYHRAQTSQPIAILGGTMVFVFLARELKFKDGAKEFTLSLSLKLGLLALVGLGGISLLPTLNPDFLNDNGRFGIYRMAYNFFSARPEFILFGLGTGSFFSWGPILQESTGVAPHNTFVWLHSDILEIIFGTGLIGGFLVLATGVQAFLRAWKTPVYGVGVSLLAYALTMVFNLPIHHPFLAFLGIFLLGVCLRCQYPKAT